MADSPPEGPPAAAPARPEVWNTGHGGAAELSRRLVAAGDALDRVVTRIDWASPHWPMYTVVVRKGETLEQAVAREGWLNDTFPCPPFFVPPGSGSCGGGG